MHTNLLPIHTPPVPSHPTSRGTDVASSIVSVCLCGRSIPQTSIYPLLLSACCWYPAAVRKTEKARTVQTVQNFDPPRARFSFHFSSHATGERRRRTIKRRVPARVCLLSLALSLSRAFTRTRLHTKRECCLCTARNHRNHGTEGQRSQRVRRRRPNQTQKCRTPLCSVDPVFLVVVVIVPPKSCLQV